ncbi:uncharacterized protein [Hemitrygon akajei]|uniref:uncharacterized protein n=1 Tax=Hemitrygon akajei TaxID=2704970 RepID=UPI003BF985CA
MAENQTDANRQFTGTDSQATLRADMGRERPTGRDRSDSSIWLICVLTATLFITGICWRIHVSQIRHQFTEMETKYRSVNETKAQICELLTSRREQACSQGWVRNQDRCYFISALENNLPWSEGILILFPTHSAMKTEQTGLENAKTGKRLLVLFTSIPVESRSALNAALTDGGPIAKVNTVLSARSLHIGARIFLKRSRISVNSP